MEHEDEVLERILAKYPFHERAKLRADLGGLSRRFEAGLARMHGGVALAIRGPSDLAGAGSDADVAVGRALRGAISASWWLLGRVEVGLTGEDRRAQFASALRFYCTLAHAPIPMEGPCERALAELDRRGDVAFARAQLVSCADIIETLVPPEHRLEVRRMALRPASETLRLCTEDRLIDPAQDRALRQVWLDLGQSDRDVYIDIRPLEDQLRRGLAGVYHLVIRTREHDLDKPTEARAAGRAGGFFFARLRALPALARVHDTESLATQVRCIARRFEWEAAARQAVARACSGAREEFPEDEARRVTASFAALARQVCSDVTSWHGLSPRDRRRRQGQRTVESVVRDGG